MPYNSSTLKVYLKKEKSKKACYINVEPNGKHPPEDITFSKWNILPDVILENIFSLLSVKDRYYASLVCREWCRGFYLPAVWSNFTIDDKTLTQAKYNYYSGWQYCLDHIRTQNCLESIGHLIKVLTLKPVYGFNNIFQFLVLISWNIDQKVEMSKFCGVGTKIRSLIFEFPCNMPRSEDPEGIRFFGTGGQLLKCLKTLMSKLKELHTLKLVDFFLQSFEAKHALDGVLYSSCFHMNILNLTNITSTHCPIMQILTLSPQNIDDAIILLLSNSKLRHFYINQNRYTPSYKEITACGPKAWQILKQSNPALKVHLRIESVSDGEVVLQPEAPVHSIIYNAPRSKMNPEVLSYIMDNYKKTLSVYGFQLLPKFCSPTRFNNRIDSLLILTCRQCENLTTVIIREKISTSTVLLIAKTLRKLKQLFLRRYGVVLRCDWPQQLNWSNKFYSWLRCSSKSYRQVEMEVSSILGRNWCFLSDKEFKRIHIEEQQ